MTENALPDHMHANPPHERASGAAAGDAPLSEVVLRFSPRPDLTTLYLFTMALWGLPAVRDLALVEVEGEIDCRLVVASTVTALLIDMVELRDPAVAGLVVEADAVRLELEPARPPVAALPSLTTGTPLITPGAVQPEATPPEQTPVQAAASTSAARVAGGHPGPAGAPAIGRDQTGPERVRPAAIPALLTRVRRMGWLPVVVALALGFGAIVVVARPSRDSVDDLEPSRDAPPKAALTPPADAPLPPDIVISSSSDGAGPPAASPTAPASSVAATIAPSEVSTATPAPAATAAQTPAPEPSATPEPAATPAVEPTTTPSPYLLYRVRPGETLFSIARSFGVSTTTLILLNGLPADGRILAGTDLLIPQAP